MTSELYDWKNKNVNSKINVYCTDVQCIQKKLITSKESITHPSVFCGSWVKYVMLWQWNLAQVVCFQQHPDQQSLRMHATDWKACLTCAWARIRRPKLAYWAQLRQLRRSHLEDGLQDLWAKKSKANRIGQCSQAVSFRIRSGKPALSAQAVWWTGATDKHLSCVGISPFLLVCGPLQISNS